jgi:hypothetical protein
MYLKNIVTNYNKYKKNYRVKKKLRDFFYKKNSISNNLLLQISYIFSFSIFIPFVVCSSLLNDIIVHKVSFLAVIMIFFTALGMFLQVRHDKKKKENINPYLSTLFSFYSMIFIKKKILKKLMNFLISI